MDKTYHIEWSNFWQKFLVILVKYDPMIMTMVSKHDSYLDAVRWTEANPL